MHFNVLSVNTAHVEAFGVLTRCNIKFVSYHSWLRVEIMIRNDTLKLGETMITIKVGSWVLTMITSNAWLHASQFNRSFKGILNSSNFFF